MDQINKYLDNPNYVFHGSDQRFNVVNPSQTKRVGLKGEINYEGISVHATPHLYLALSYTYDRSNAQCYRAAISLFEKDNEMLIIGKKSLEESLQNLWPKGKFGYIYVLDKNQFHHVKGLGPLEVISLEPVKPIRVLKIGGIPTLLKKMEIELFFKEANTCQNKTK